MFKEVSSEKSQFNRIPAVCFNFFLSFYKISKKEACQYPTKCKKYLILNTVLLCNKIVKNTIVFGISLLSDCDTFINVVFSFYFLILKYFFSR